MDGGEKDPKMKQKKGDTAAVCASKEAASSPQWPWQNMVENLQLAHQELSVIIDLINTLQKHFGLKEKDYDVKNIGVADPALE